MKANIFITSILIAFISSCTSIYFDKPLPVDGEEHKSVPHKFYGVWVVDEDKIIIDKAGLTVIEFQTKKETKAYIDTVDNLFFKSSSLYMKRENVAIKCEILSDEQDTITYKYKTTDQYFLSDSLLLKSSEEYYFFNFSEDGNYWAVILMMKTDKSIVFKYLNQDDIKSLKTQGFVTTDSIKTMKFGGEDHYCKSNLTKDRIIEFINNGGFSDTLLLLDNEKGTFR